MRTRIRACWLNNVALRPAYIANIEAAQNTVKEAETQERSGMKLNYFGALICILLWIYLAFVAAIPSGWVHVPLAVGVVLVATGIARDDGK